MDRIQMARQELARRELMRRGELSVGRNIKDIPESEFQPKNPYLETAKTVGTDIIQPLSKTLTGKSAADIIDSKVGAAPFADAYGKGRLAQTGAFAKSYGAGLVGDIADIAQTPASYIPIPGGKLLGKIPVGSTTLGRIAENVAVTKRKSLIPVSGGEFKQGVTELQRMESTLQNRGALSSRGTYPQQYISARNNAILWKAGQIITQPLMGRVNSAIDKGSKYFARIKSRVNPTEDYVNINVPPKQRLAALSQKGNKLAGQDIHKINMQSAEISQIKKEGIQQLGYQKKDLETFTTRAIAESRSVLKRNLQKIHVNLQQAAEAGSAKFQELLPYFFYANSEAYGHALNAAFSWIVGKGQAFTKKKVSDLLNKTVLDMDEALIPMDAPGRQAINSLVKKYETGIMQETSSILDVGGKPIAGKIISSGDDLIDMKQLNQDLKNVRTNLSAGAKSGTSRFNQEDLAIQFLNNNVGEEIKIVYPKFAQLQEDYTPVIRAMKEAHRIFKPTQGEYKTLTGTNFIRRAAMGKLEAGERNMLDVIEKGSKFAPGGVGPITQPAKEIGLVMKGTIAEGITQKEKLISNLQSKIDVIENQRRNLIGTTDEALKKQRIALNDRKLLLEKRKADIVNRRDKLTVLLANKVAAEKISKSMLPLLEKFIPAKYRIMAQVKNKLAP